MHGQRNRAYAEPVEQTARDHPPAHSALQSAQCEAQKRQPEAAAKLIDAALDAAPNIPRILMGHRGLGAEDVRWHLLMGDEDAAIAALTDAFDSGWRLRHPRSEKRLFDRLTHRAEFQALVDALHAHMRNQRLKDEKSNPPAKENAAR